MPVAREVNGYGFLAFTPLPKILSVFSQLVVRFDSEIWQQSLGFILYCDCVWPTM
jgi:hypothetical protein